MTLQRLVSIITMSLLSALLLLPSNTWAYSPYSTTELEQLEKEFIEQINQANNVIRDPLANQYINHLAKTLALHGQLPQPYFFIVKSNEINAFAGPGGYIGVNSQLILSTENESELAAVMAHEMAHVRLHHLYQMIEHQKQMRIPMLASMLASMALGVLNPALGSGAMMASVSGFAQDSINFVRSNEKEADRIGIGMLIKSGLDPRGMAGFFKKMQQSSRYYYTANIPAILRTHPLDEDRIAEAESRSLQLDKKNYTDSLDYRLFKEFIRSVVTDDGKQLIDYYRQQCRKHNSEIACQYGNALALININQYQKAEEQLAPLLNQNPDNLYFTITMAQAEIGRKQFAGAVSRLRQLKENYPENYAALISYAQILVDAGEAEQAASILLRGTRLFKYDLPMCQQLARAEAANHRKDYAYFTEAQCQLLQGRGKEALKRLKTAQLLATKDHLLQARITAKIDEVKFLLEK
jgi:predicted Zn-dependent protease